MNFHYEIECSLPHFNISVICKGCSFIWYITIYRSPGEFPRYWDLNKPYFRLSKLCKFSRISQRDVEALSKKQEQKYVYIHLASSSNYYSKLIRIKNLNFLHRNQHYFHGNNRPFATSRHYFFLLTSKSYQNRRMRIKDFHTSYISERPCEVGVDKIAALGFQPFFTPFMYTDNEMGSFFS